MYFLLYLCDILTAEGICSGSCATILTYIVLVLLCCRTFNLVLVPRAAEKLQANKPLNKNEVKVKQLLLSQSL